MRKIFLIGVVILIAGCATEERVAQSSAEQTQFAQDRYKCEQEAASMYPPVYGQRPQPSSQQRQTIGSVLSDYAAQQDQNRGRRENAIQSCLAAKGYR